MPNTDEIQLPDLRKSSGDVQLPDLKKKLDTQQGYTNGSAPSPSPIGGQSSSLGSGIDFKDLWSGGKAPEPNAPLATGNVSTTTPTQSEVPHTKDYNKQPIPLEDALNNVTVAAKAIEGTGQIGEAVGGGMKILAGGLLGAVKGSQQVERGLTSGSPLGALDVGVGLGKEAFAIGGLTVPEIMAWNEGFDKLNDVAPNLSKNIGNFFSSREIDGKLIIPIGDVYNPRTDNRIVLDHSKIGQGAIIDILDFIPQAIVGGVAHEGYGAAKEGVMDGYKAIAEKIKGGEKLTPEEDVKATQAVGDYISNPDNIIKTSTLNKMPAELSDQQKIKAAPLVEQKQNLEQANLDLLGKKATVDEAFHPQIDKEIADNEKEIKNTTTEIQKAINLPKEKTETDAIQEPETGKVLQREQEAVGEKGSERERVEPSLEGKETSNESKGQTETLTPTQEKVNEEVPVPKDSSSGEVDLHKSVDAVKEVENLKAQDLKDYAANPSDEFPEKEFWKPENLDKTSVENKAIESRVKNYDSPDSLKGTKPEHILHFNQGVDNNRVTLLVDPEVKTAYSEKLSKAKAKSIDGKANIKDPLKDIAKEFRGSYGQDKIVDLRGMDLTKPVKDIVAELNKEPETKGKGRSIGETPRDFAQRTLEAKNDLEKNAPDKAAVVFHSKGIKVWNAMDDLGIKTKEDLNKALDNGDFGRTLDRQDEPANDAIEKELDNGKKLYIIRHGETPHDIADKNSGQSEIGLAPEGKSEVKETNYPKDISEIYSSPLERAKQTANLIRDKINAERGGKIEKEQPINKLEREYNAKGVDELVALKKKLYANPDIESAMSTEEKLLSKVIAKKYSDINEQIRQKRENKAESESKANKEKTGYGDLLKERKNLREKTPDSLQEYVLQHFANGGKLNRADFESITGLHGEDVPKNLISKNAPTIESLHSSIMEEGKAGNLGFKEPEDYRDFRDAFIDAMKDVNDTHDVYSKLSKLNKNKDLSDEQINMLADLHAKAERYNLDPYKVTHEDLDYAESQLENMSPKQEEERLKDLESNNPDVNIKDHEEKPNATTDTDTSKTGSGTSDDTGSKKGTGEEKSTEQKVEPPSKEPPPKEKVKVGTGDEETVGVSHAALTDLANRLGLKAPEHGESPTAEQLADRGRKLLNAGADPNEVNNSNNSLYDRISIGRAHLEDLREAADQIAKTHPDGVNSEAFKDALKDIDKYIAKVKSLGNEAHQAFVALQGRRGIDTGSFTSVRNAVEEIQEKPITVDQQKKIDELTKQNTELKTKAEDLEKKLVEASENEFNKERVREKRKFANTAKKAADAFRKLKTKAFEFVDENGVKHEFKTSGLSLNDLVEYGAKAIEKTGDIADGISAILDKIKDADWYKALSDTDKGKFEKQLHEHYTDQIKNTPEAKNIRRLEKQLDDLRQGNIESKGEKRKISDKEKELQEQIAQAKKELGLFPSTESPVDTERTNEAKLTALQEKFADKQGNKFTPDESKAIWSYAKESYIDKGVSYQDMIGQVSKDLGLSWRQTAEALTSPRIKPISDAMWAKQSQYRRGQIATKNWVEAQNQSPAYKAWAKTRDAIKGLQVYGHGGLFVGTHAGMTLFHPETWYRTIPAFINGYKLAYGKEANYEMAVRQLKDSDNYVTAQAAGLQNNPDVFTGDDYSQSQTAWGKIGLAGQKGFTAVKILRQQLFDHYYDNLTEAEKADPKTAEAVARLVNNATGATNWKVPSAVTELTFAGGMEMARWEKLTKNPTKATSTAIKALINPDKASASDKVFAKIWASRVGQQMGVMAGMLIANAAIQNTLNPNNKVNLINPDKEGWLKFKFGNMTVDPSSGMVGTVGFMKNIAVLPFESMKERHGNTQDASGKKAIGYVRGKLAPAYSTLADLYTKTDYFGNPLPFSSDKPAAGKHQLSLLEYASQRLPIPVADAFKVAYQSAVDNGSSPTQFDNILRGIISGTLTGSTGFRVNEKSEGEETKGKFGDSEIKSTPALKYFSDKGFEMPYTSLASESIKDKATSTIKKISELPREVQDKYQATHKENLIEELSKVKNNGYVYVNQYGQAIPEHPKTHEKGEVYKKVELDKLTDEQTAEILNKVQSKATEKTKKVMFKQ